MNKYTIIIYVIIVGVAILSSIIKKAKKTGTTNNNIPKKTSVNYNQPTTSTYKKPATTQPKSLEDILQSLLNEQKPQKTVAPKVEEKMVLTDKQPQKFTTLDESQSLEKEEVQFFSSDEEYNYTDEMVEYDKTTDHRVHGGVFGELKIEEQVEVESEWANIDWRKAIITAEILKRPNY